MRRDGTVAGVRPRVLLDVDPGYDDLVAMAVAGALTDLVLVTTAAGNGTLEETTRSARRAVIELGIDAPVVAGDDGAAAAMAEQAAPGSWIVAVAPLTNVAEALRLDPDLAGRVAGISIMGGDWSPGADPARERNHATDPDAAATVARSGAQLVRCGLDVTTQVRVDDRWIEALRAPLLRTSLREYARLHTHRQRPGTPVHDPCAVLAVTHPHLFDLEETGPGTWVARRIDAPEALRVLAEALGGGRS